MPGFDEWNFVFLVSYLVAPSRPWKCFLSAVPSEIRSRADIPRLYRFEAFDEPWKVIFNTDLDNWESKWGLMDENRNIKTGLIIPDCDGQTIDKPY